MTGPARTRSLRPAPSAPGSNRSRRETERNQKKSPREEDEREEKRRFVDVGIEPTARPIRLNAVTLSSKDVVFRLRGDRPQPVHLHRHHAGLVSGLLPGRIEGPPSCLRRRWSATGCPGGSGGGTGVRGSAGRSATRSYLYVPNKGKIGDENYSVSRQRSGGSETDGCDYLTGTWGWTSFCNLRVSRPSAGGDYWQDPSSRPVR